MATQQVEGRFAYIWSTKPEWWDKQRSLIVATRSVPGVTKATTCQEYLAIVQATVDHATENDIPFEVVFMNPDWVRKELNEARLPITAEGIASVFHDPLGIERKGIKAAW